MKGKFFIISVSLMVLLSSMMTGCKKKIEEKIEEKIVESIIEEATGGEIDINNNITTTKTERGQTIMGDDLKWPKDIMGNLPELKANINMIMEDHDKEKDINLGMVYFDGLKDDDVGKYVESLKELNYKSIFETSSDGGYIYSGNNEEGAEVVFTYNGDGTGSLSYTDNQFMFLDNPYDSDYSQGSSATEDVDMTDDVPWPKDFFNELPELEGKITQVSTSSPQDKFVYIEYVTKDMALDYVNKIKDIGFIEAPSESQSASYLTYEASNEKGDYIMFDWSDSEIATINFLKGE